MKFWYIRNMEKLPFASKKQYRLLSNFFVLLLMTFILPSNTQCADNKLLKTGEYLYFGRYYGEDILWRVINDPEKDDGALLFSEKIISMKSFDAAGHAAGGRDDRRKTRERYGSGYWPDSTLRKWLNSYDETVTYLYFPPTEERVMGRQNYEDEPGFLYNFTEVEIKMLKPYTHRVLLSPAEAELSEGGTEPYSYHPEIAHSMDNFDSSYYQYVTDKVFVPGIDIIYNLVYSRNWSYFKTPTPSLVEEEGIFVERRNIPFTSDTYWWYWLTTPFADSLRFMVVMATDRIGAQAGTISLLHPNDGNGGVAPLIYIPKFLNISEGDGSSSDPYLPNLEPK